MLSCDKMASEDAASDPVGDLDITAHCEPVNYIINSELHDMIEAAGQADGVVLEDEKGGESANSIFKEKMDTRFSCCCRAGPRTQTSRPAEKSGGGVGWCRYLPCCSFYFISPCPHTTTSQIMGNKRARQTPKLRNRNSEITFRNRLSSEISETPKPKSP